MEDNTETTETPSWSKLCERCNRVTIERWPGQETVSCWSCGDEYNAFGQRLRCDWRGNRSWSDDDVDDLEGFEIQQLGYDC